MAAVRQPVKIPTEAELLKMPAKDYMNDVQLAFFRQQLEKQREELMNNAGETSEHLRETPAVPDPADRATIERIDLTVPSAPALTRRQQGGA